MTYDALSSLYRDRLDDIVEKRVAALVAGNAKDHADYASRVGELRGIKIARDVFREALQLMTKDDD